MNIGPYEILGELGRGGMGVVYRARRREGGAVVAVKTLHAGDGTGAETIRRFQREVSLARALDHPGIVKVLDAGEQDGLAWFSMECVDGQALSRIIRDEPLPWTRAVDIARDVADALASAHARGILHRDVKPSNILIGRKVSGSRSPTVDVEVPQPETRDQRRSARTCVTSASPSPSQRDPSSRRLAKRSGRRNT